MDSRVLAINYNICVLEAIKPTLYHLLFFPALQCAAHRTDLDSILHSHCEKSYAVAEKMSFVNVALQFSRYQKWQVIKWH